MRNYNTIFAWLGGLLIGIGLMIGDELHALTACGNSVCSYVSYPVASQLIFLSFFSIYDAEKVAWIFVILGAAFILVLTLRNGSDQVEEKLTRAPEVVESKS